MTAISESEYTELCQKIEDIETSISELRNELKVKDQLIEALTTGNERLDDYPASSLTQVLTKINERLDDSLTEEKLSSLTHDGFMARVPIVDRIHSMLRVPEKFSSQVEFIKFYLKLKTIFQSMGYYKSFEIFENESIDEIKEIKTSDAFILSNYLTSYFYKAVSSDLGDVLYEDDLGDGEFNNGYVLLNKLWVKHFGSRDQIIDIYAMIEKISIGKNYDNPDAIRTALKYIYLIMKIHVSDTRYEESRVATTLSQNSSKPFQDAVTKMLERSGDFAGYFSYRRYSTVESILNDLEKWNRKRKMPRSTFDVTLPASVRLINGKSKKAQKSTDAKILKNGGSESSTFDSKDSNVNLKNDQPLKKCYVGGVRISYPDGIKPSSAPDYNSGWW